MSKKQIMFISRGMAYGGSARTIVEISEGLLHAGYDVVLVVLRNYDVEYPYSEELKTERLGLYTKETKVGKKDVITKWFPYIHKKIMEYKPDLVIPFGVDVCILTLLMKYKMTKVCATVRSNPCAEPKNALGRLVRDFFYGRADYIWVQNTEQAQLMPSVEKERIIVCPNPLRDSLRDFQFEYSDKPTRLVTVGRLSPPKNHFLLLRSIKELMVTIPEISLDIYGEGELQEELQKYIDSNGMQRNVVLRGRVKNVERELVKHDIFILSSNFEGMPNALMEAMAVGMPCISTSCSTGPSELIDNGKNGLLVSVNKTDELVAAIKSLINDPKKCREIGTSAKADVWELYSKQSVCERIVKCLGEIWEHETTV